MSLYLGENLISGITTTVGNADRIGEYKFSSLPITDAGLHLADGALINGSGIYSAFVNYVADLYTANPSANYFTTEANWQSSVSTYGVCAKYVYDSVNNTVRLPKVTGFVEGTIDAAALGELIEAGLPNITGSLGFCDDNDTQYNARIKTCTGAFSTSAVSQLFFSGSGGSTQTAGSTANIDASLSSSIYKNNFNKVQPQAVKGYLYIVIATTTKTEVEVDIDEVVTDLNGKADTDLTNLTSTATPNFDSRWVVSHSTFYNNAVLSASGSQPQYTVDLSNYLPNDNYVYQVQCMIAQYDGNIIINTDYTYNSGGLWSSSPVRNMQTYLIGTNRKIYFNVYSGCNQFYFEAIAYRRIGTNA